MSRPRKEACGCWSTDTHWTELCQAHRAEVDEVRARWHAERRARRAGETVTGVTPEGLVPAGVMP